MALSGSNFMWGLQKNVIFMRLIAGIYVILHY